ncbi:molybdenum ABC transporter substrate-binding protein, partial [Enterobacter cloacae]|uniref:substrate-binding domain-containing protein n=1 Tax=Enterobacter cloacae TaxID=550 RepID=UPI001027412C
MRTFVRSGLTGLVIPATRAGALAQEVAVMISGGFKAALEKPAPQYEARTGDLTVLIPGPSMGQTPQAIPNRLARGAKADVVIMVDDALAHLAKDRMVKE